ncbi:Sin3 associated polypeptide p18-domain-containing protein [Powellomyces hirtus]|nr:Sin3 associated polypeptide p18-domain-containing protein [Powellomyces hirtus]
MTTEQPQQMDTDVPTPTNTTTPAADAGDGSASTSVNQPPSAQRRASTSEMKGDGDDEEKEDTHRHKLLERPTSAVANASSHGHAPASLHDARPGNRRRLNVDREKVCPFLVRLYVSTDHEFTSEEIERRGLPEKSEVLLHTWKNATLRELASLLTPTHPAALERLSAITFQSVIRTQTRGSEFRVTPVGTVYNFRPSPDDQKTLEQAKFVIGDGLLVSILKCDPANKQSHRGTSNGSASNTHLAGMHPDRRESLKTRDAFTHPDRHHNQGPPHRSGNPRFEPYGGGPRSGRPPRYDDNRRGGRDRGGAFEGGRGGGRERPRW